MHSSTCALSIIFIALLVFSIDVSAQNHTGPDRSDIEKLINGIEKYHYKDAAKFASLFTENGLLITSTGQAIKGAKKLQDTFTRSYAKIYSGEIDVSIDDLELTENIAVVRGVISETIQPTESARPLQAQYYYSLLAKKIGNRWKAVWMMGVAKNKQ